MARRILLHICCGPCSIYPVRRLQEQGFEVTGLYYNFNIHPAQEYIRRREGAKEVAAGMGFKLICRDEDYNPETYLRSVAFREENRCFLCYQLRLSRVLSIAGNGGFDFFSSTLLYSRFQKHDLICSLAADMAGSGKVRFWREDFRLGWQEGIDLSKKWGIYRQQYCGCVYSEFERYRREVRGPKPEARK